MEVPLKVSNNFSVGDKVWHNTNRERYGIGTILKVNEEHKLVCVTWQKCPEYGKCWDHFSAKIKLTPLEELL